MRNILQEDEVFQEFEKCCEKKSEIKKELDNPEITDERKNDLKERLRYMEKEISELELKLQDRIKVS